MKIVFASNNAGKTRELQTLLADFKITLVPQREMGVNDIVETASTFVENALLKARHASELTGLPALADDSGLAVSALGGAPGIYSARYAGPQFSPKDNILKLLDDLKNIPDNNRQACFHCVLVYLTHAADPTPLICHGTWKGSILRTLQGEGGFGYDPVFYVPSEHLSAAQLTPEIKNQLSHRGKALRLLMEQLPEKLISDF